MKNFTVFLIWLINSLNVYFKLMLFRISVARNWRTTFLRLAYSGDESTPSHYKYKKKIRLSSGFSAGKSNTKPLKQTGVDNSILKIDTKLIFRFSIFTQIWFVGQNSVRFSILTQTWFVGQSSVRFSILTQDFSKIKFKIFCQ